MQKQSLVREFGGCVPSGQSLPFMWDRHRVQHLNETVGRLAAAANPLERESGSDLNNNAYSQGQDYLTSSFGCTLIGYSRKWTSGVLQGCHGSRTGCKMIYIYVVYGGDDCRREGNRGSPVSAVEQCKRIVPVCLQVHLSLSLNSYHPLTKDLDFVVWWVPGEGRRLVSGQRFETTKNYRDRPAPLVWVCLWPDCRSRSLSPSLCRLNSRNCWNPCSGRNKENIRRNDDEAVRDANIFLTRKWEKHTSATVQGRENTKNKWDLNNLSEKMVE